MVVYWMKMVIQNHALALLLLWFQIFQIVVAAFSSFDGTILRKLIRPQWNCQFIFKVPSPLISAQEFALSELIDHVTMFRSPYQIFVSGFNNSYVLRGSARFTENCLIWITFPPRDSSINDTLNLNIAFPHDTVDSDGLETVRALNPYSDLVLLLVDGSVSVPKYLLFSPQRSCSAPLNLLIVEYNSSKLLHHPLHYSLQCHSPLSLCLEPLDFLKAVNLQGVENLVVIMKQKRKNFRGGRIAFSGPYIPSNVSWNRWKRYLKYPLYLSRVYPELALAHHLALFAQKNNLTFDTLIENGPKCSKPLVVTGVYERNPSGSATTEKSGVLMTPLSLERFTSFSVSYITDLTQPDPFKLNSLAAPLNPPDFCLFVLLTTLASLMALLKLKSPYVTPVVYLMLSAVFDQNCSKRLSSKLKFWYTAWFLLVWVIGTIYVNMIQSLVIVPDVPTRNISFQELVEKQFNFYAYGYDIKLMAKAPYRLQSTQEGTVALGPDPDHSLKAEITLLTIMKPIRGQDLLFKSMKQGNVAFVFSKEDAFIFSAGMPRLKGRTFHTRSYEFFPLPTWWTFKWAINADVLYESLESFRDGGFTSFWERNYFNGAIKRRAKQYSKEVDKDDLADDINTESKAGIMLSYESFVLYIYGISASLLAFLTELTVWSVV